MIGGLLQYPPDVTGKQEMSTSAGKALKKMPATWVLSEPVGLSEGPFGNFPGRFVESQFGCGIPFSLSSSLTGYVSLSKLLNPLLCASVF